MTGSAQVDSESGEHKNMTKEKLSSRQFMLIIDGPSCGGKSTVSKVLLEQYGGIFNAESDQIKWLISDYTPDTHKGIVYEMTIETIRGALKNNLSVLKQGMLFKPERLVQIAGEFSVPLFVANISAPMEVLEKRFSERIERKKNGARIANTDHARFSEMNNMYLATKIDSQLEFDSSLQSPEEISRAISEYIKANLH